MRNSLKIEDDDAYGMTHEVDLCLSTSMYAYTHGTHTHTHKATHMYEHSIGYESDLDKDITRVFQTLAFNLFLLIALLIPPRHDHTEVFLDSTRPPCTLKSLFRVFAYQCSLQKKHPNSYVEVLPPPV